MKRKREAPLQINKFVGGLNTEFNPLEVSPETTSEEVNMEMQRDGSRKKRLGFSFEENFTLVDTGLTNDTTKNISTSVYKWENAGGLSEKYLYVVQIGNFISIFDPDLSSSVSSGKIYEETLDVNSYSNDVDYAVVDGLLVLTNGQKEVCVYEYDETTGISKDSAILKIRDLFGVEDVIQGIDYSSQQYLNKRPEFTTSSHNYNLRNQTFSYPRKINNGEALEDTIRGFISVAGRYPSNADNVTAHFYPDPNDSGDRITERFFATSMYSNPPGIARAPIGFFIIDALERGASRQEQYQNLMSDYPQLVYNVTSLKRDETPGGANVVCEFAGRVWYGGFSGDIVDGDSKSPRMSSYILFTVVIKDKSDLGKCHQEADPTSNEDPDVVPTDGGFVRIDGAYGIKRMVGIDNSMFILASNGVWRITGSEEGAFSATSYQVKKITDRGCISKNSVVQVGNALFYWGEDAIYRISQNELGVWNSQDITKGKIQSFYFNIDSISKEKCTGHFDSFERKIRWVYSGRLGTASQSNELILNIDFGSFTPNSVSTFTDRLPLIVGVTETSPYDINNIETEVTVNNIPVTLSGAGVTVNVRQEFSILKEVIYLSISEVSPTIKFTFGSFDSLSLYDFGTSVSGLGYPAYLVTGSLSGGEARFKKHVPYLNIFFRRSEDGFNENLSSTSETSCLLSTQWNWTTNAFSNKWTTPRQAYRNGRLYFPTGDADNFNSGDLIIPSRNKIRGLGHSLAFRLESEEGKDLHVYGWSFSLQSNGQE